jgi:DNA-nicking Smr family endonuclease
VKKPGPPRTDKRSSSKLPLSRRAPLVASDDDTRRVPPAPVHDYARGAEPLPPASRRVPPPLRPSVPPVSSAPGIDDLAPVFELSSDESKIEGARVGFARRLRELSRGLLPVFETLDLHGMTVEKAESAVRSFCANARGTVPRTVLIVHGKGMHSQSGRAVLRDAVAHWLSSAPVARDVLCFATARPKHGGGGAMYVLLAARPAAPGLGTTRSGRPRG